MTICWQCGLQTVCWRYSVISGVIGGNSQTWVRRSGATSGRFAPLRRLAGRTVLGPELNRVLHLLGRKKRALMALVTDLAASFAPACRT